MRLIKKIFILISIITIFGFTASAVYIETNKDTKLPPDSVTVVPLNTEGYTAIADNANFTYYYKKHNGILAVYDKRNGYTWKSGIDHDNDVYIRNKVELFIAQNPDATDEEILAIAQPLEEQMNNTREGIANSLILIEYLNRTNVTRPMTQTGSSLKNYIVAPDPNNPGLDSVQERVATSVDTDVLNMVNNNPNHFRLDFRFRVIDVTVRVHLHFNLDGFMIEIRDAELTGDDVDLIGALSIAPFMGSYGGKISLPRVVTENVGSEAEPIIEREVVWDNETLKTRNPGYIFVPDGSGALIRFNDYSTSLHGYTGSIYGEDLAQLPRHTQFQPNFVPFKQPTMPVFGISYGDGTQAAFLSHTTKGQEYMQIYARPSNSADTYNLTDYMIAHSRYVYNRVYTQVYNQSGASYQSLFENRNHVDINQHFNFLAGDGSSVDNPYPADYVGMALKYRDYLSSSEVGILTQSRAVYPNIPVRIDFLMADAKNALVGTEDVITTTINQAESILLELQSSGVYNINSGLIGYQKGGATLGRKSSPDWNDRIGSRSNFARVAGNLNEQGIDISLHQNYSIIYDNNLFLIGNAMKHIGGWYSNMVYNRVTGPVTGHYYATPHRVQSWFNNTVNRTSNMNFNSYTVDGISNLLYSHYESSNNNTTVTYTINMYQNVFENLDDQILINAVKPNMYLWPYVTRHLQTPMFSTQHIIQTDTVPFLQMVLNGSMELYATYSNFSFYQPKDILRMIDYNTYPSFVLTHDPSYKLVATHSSDYYSTEYTLYKDMIKDIYTTVDSALAGIQNTLWTNRTVLAPGVIVNTYSNGIQIVINYTDDAYSYNGLIVQPLDFRIIV